MYINKALLVLVLGMTLAGCPTKQVKGSLPPLPPEPMVCSVEAIVDRKEYELPPPPRLADKRAQDLAFREWQASALIKYPQLLVSYDLLRGCWEHYALPKKK